MSYLTPQYAFAPTQAGAFRSLTDALDPAPAIIPEQHFVEWFSGAALDSIWTETQILGGGSGAMDDIVNGGYKLTNATGGSQWTGIGFNGINHYDRTASKFVSTFRRNTTSTVAICGLKEVASDGTNWNMVAMISDTAGSFFELRSGTGSTTSDSATTVSLDTNYHKFASELRSASMLGFVDDTLEVLKTDNLPAADLEPLFTVFSIDTSVERTGNILQYEAFNT
jgi:hypothetical protein